MEQVTLEKVLTEAKQLSDEEKWQLRTMLDNELGLQNGFKTIEQIAREQGKRPVSFQELLGPQPDEDDDDDVDEFLKELRQWRDESSLRELD